VQAVNPDWEGRVRSDFARQGAMRLIGAEIAAAEPGLCRLRAPFREDLSQHHGYFHAGITSALADTAGGFAGYSLMPAGGEVLTTEFKINLVAPAKGSALLATGRVVKPGRTLTVCELRVEAETGGGPVLVAVGLQTLICLMPRS